MIGAIVPVYNPDADLEGRLRRITPQVDRLYLVDDGSSVERRALVRAAAHDLGCTLIENDGNLGIAAAFNRGAAAALSDRCDHVLLLDQDTRPDPDMVARLLALLAAADGPPVAVLAANYLDAGGRLAYRVPPDQAVAEIPVAISSGSLIPMDAYQALGGMDEGLFIDEVDHEFCLRARARGFRVLATRDPLARHEVGRQRLYRLAGLSFSMSNHPPMRRYYMARNRLIVARRYARRFPGWVAGMLLRSGVEVALIPVLEPDRMQKVRAVLRGVVDGVAGRSGRQPP